MGVDGLLFSRLHSHLTKECDYRCTRINGSHNIFLRAGVGCLPVPVHNHKVSFDLVRIIMKHVRRHNEKLQI